MNRGEVWWVDFSSAAGGEVRKARPAVIVSNNSANRFLNRVQVVPLASNVEKLYPSEAYVSLGKVRNKAMADQLATVSKQRLQRRKGKLSSTDMRNVERAIKTQLGLS